MQLGASERYGGLRNHWNRFSNAQRIDGNLMGSMAIIGASETVWQMLIRCGDADRHSIGSDGKRRCDGFRERARESGMIYKLTHRWESNNVTDRAHISPIPGELLKLVIDNDCLWCCLSRDFNGTFIMKSPFAVWRTIPEHDSRQKNFSNLFAFAGNFKLEKKTEIKPEAKLQTIDCWRAPIEANSLT